ncbi:RNA polymerase sigma factor [Kerstersia gyiorum]|uniref:RNA polymerase sigma factor n=1 Tax=Kerstersia gyiorum TaxID=206506 RepID=UPI003B434635
MPSLAQVVEELTGAYTELKRYLGWKLNDSHKAADIAQESFERVYHHALKGKVARPRALLFSAARNLIIDQGRSEQRDQCLLDELGQQTAADSEVASVEQQVLHRRQLERVAARLQRLPRKRREVFVLARIYGYSYAEIAARMDISIDAVEKHIARAALDCSDLIEQEGAACAPRK